MVRSKKYNGDDLTKKRLDRKRDEHNMKNGKRNVEKLAIGVKSFNI